MPRISVIVPIYKVEAYLEKCINSLINQTAHDYEIILVDDGSPDNCPAICDKYAGDYDGIKVIHKPNGGVSSARNAGIEKANGEFIWFVDADDYVEPNAIEFLLAQATSNYDIIVFERKIQESGDIRNYTDFFKKYYLTYSLGFEPWNKLYKRELIEKNHLRFDTEERIGEDLLFNAIYYRYIKNYSIQKKHIYHYEQREDSAMQGGKPERMIQQMRLYDKMMTIWDNTLDESISCSLFVMHLFAGINQSKNSGITKQEYKEHLRKQLNKVQFSKKAWKEGIEMFLNAENASFLSGLKIKLCLWLNRRGIYV